MEWLSSHWTLSAVAGVVSGSLVTVIIRHLFSGREQRDYQQNVTTANSEILYAIRPAIAEKVIPSGAMLEALFSATARKYAVDVRDLLPRAGIANELIKEIVDNAFLTSQQKVEYCELLGGMKKPDFDASPKRALEGAASPRRGESSDPSAILGVATALTAFAMTLFFFLKDRGDLMLDGQPWTVFPMLAVVSIIPVVAYLLVDLARQVTRPRREIDEPKPGARREGPPVTAELTGLEGKAPLAS